VLPGLPELSAAQLDDALTEVLELQALAPTEASHFEHHRQAPRIPLNLPAEVAIYSARRPRRSARGSACLRNISMGGAFIDTLQLENTDLLSRPFRIMLALHEAPWQGWKAYGRVVRLASNGELSAGVEFIRTPRRHQAQLEALARAPG
jgi:hypothetical protein